MRKREERIRTVSDAVVFGTVSDALVTLVKYALSCSVVRGELPHSPRPLPPPPPAPPRLPGTPFSSPAPPRPPGTPFLSLTVFADGRNYRRFRFALSEKLTSTLILHPSREGGKNDICCSPRRQKTLSLSKILKQKKTM